MHNFSNSSFLFLNNIPSNKVPNILNLNKNNQIACFKVNQFRVSNPSSEDRQHNNQHYFLSNNHSYNFLLNHLDSRKYKIKISEIKWIKIMLNYNSNLSSHWGRIINKEYSIIRMFLIWFHRIRRMSLKCWKN